MTNPADEKQPAKIALNALRVIVLDERISEFLTDNDPKALEQVRDAIAALTSPVVVKNTYDTIAEEESVKVNDVLIYDGELHRADPDSVAKDTIVALGFELKE